MLPAAKKSRREGKMRSARLPSEHWPSEAQHDMPQGEVSMVQYASWVKSSQ